MEYLAIAVVFGIMLCLFAFLDDKLKEQNRSINRLYEEMTLSRAEISKLTEQVMITDRQEKKVLEGMGNILNYNLDIARKAASAHVGEEE